MLKIISLPDVVIYSGSRKVLYHLEYIKEEINPKKVSFSFSSRYHRTHFGSSSVQAQARL